MSFKKGVPPNLTPLLQLKYYLCFGYLLHKNEYPLRKDTAVCPPARRGTENFAALPLPRCRRTHAAAVASATLPFRQQPRRRAMIEGCAL